MAKKKNRGTPAARKKAKQRKRLEALFSPEPERKPKGPPAGFELRWTPEKIDAMKTGEILALLGTLGIPLTEEQAREDILNWNPLNAGKLGTMWVERAGVADLGREGDFPWMAAQVLWKRLCPDHPNVEEWEELVWKGWSSSEIEDFNFSDPLAHWIEAWEVFKKLHRPEWKTMEQMATGLEEFNLRDEDCGSWLESFFFSLRIGTLKTPGLWKKYHDSIKREYLEMFPEDDEDWRTELFGKRTEERS